MVYKYYKKINITDMRNLISFDKCMNLTYVELNIRYYLLVTYHIKMNKVPI